MFVASLNLDLFFKKVFSNKRIAKKFLEDFFGVKITEIKFKSVENKITDAAVIVKFDFRCKINGEYCVIEMQQKYKIDVIKRFYLYQAVSTALQLETLKLATITKPDGETYTEKNYSGLEPVITLVWMVDDMLGFEDDFIAFTTLPEATKDFVMDADLWTQPLERILEKREKVVKILENNTKGFDFFTKNRMIYVFQKNIIKNKRVNLPYFKWFDLANISRNPNNTEEDFSQYKDDKDMAEVISRIRKDKLPADEFKYVSDLYMYDIHIARMEQDFKEKMKRREASSEKRIAKMEARQKEAMARQNEAMAQQNEAMAQQNEAMAQQNEAMAQQNEAMAQEKQKAEIRLLKSIKMLIAQGETIASIAASLDISVEETTKLVEQIQKM